MPESQLIIHAPNVHQGGGRSLLLSVLKAINHNYHAKVVIDTRMALPEKLSDRISIIKVKPNIVSRLKAEWDLKKQTDADDTVIRFGNLPPLFKIKAKAYIFVQNRFLVDKVALKGFPFFVKMRLIFERLWLAWRSESNYQFIVQTLTMQRIMRNNLGINPIVLTLIDDMVMTDKHTYKNRKCSSVKYDFLYVASGDPNKNHRRLIEAWCLLAGEGVRPSLCLTLSEKLETELSEWIIAKRDAYDMNIDLIGSISYSRVKNLYSQAQALIYPSTLESMGLPLIEAKSVDLPILASELDFVRDLVNPDQTFDPYSAVSIARAVKRFLGIKEPHTSLVNGARFIEWIFNQSC